MRRLVLWDIDGTLVRVGRVGSYAFANAVENVTGMRPAREILMSGKTDLQIVREFLDTMRVPDAGDLVPDVLVQLALELQRTEAEMRRIGSVLPGVGELLRSLSEDAHTTQTVVTGNIAPNAALKLKVFGLDEWLDLEIGAYGSDREQRRELVPIALERAQRIRGLRFDLRNVWVVGDTPADLECARVAGARSLLVATGRTPFSELEALGADAVLPDLHDFDAVIRVLDTETRL
jgi:phosphoglycolate phosphatase